MQLTGREVWWLPGIYQFSSEWDPPFQSRYEVKAKLDEQTPMSSGKFWAIAGFVVIITPLPVPWVSSLALRTWGFNDWRLIKNLVAMWWKELLTFLPTGPASTSAVSGVIICDGPLAFDLGITYAWFSMGKSLTVMGRIYRHCCRSYGLLADLFKN